MMPLYEAKMIHLYDTRWATYEPDGSVRDVTPEEKRDPNFHVMPRYWVHENEVDKKLAGKWDKSWMLGWRWVARSTDERTLISALMPLRPVGNSLPLAFHGGDPHTVAALWASMCLDYVARQKLGGSNMTYTVVSQLPVPTPETLASHLARVSELTGQLIDSPQAVSTRVNIRAELDALMLRIYGVTREDANHILETFPIVKRKDIAAHGEYLTKRLILEAYDRLTEVFA